MLSGIDQQTLRLMYRMNTDYVLVASYEQDEEFEDKDKKIKDELTDFVNKKFLKYTKNEMMLISMVYKNLNPLLDEYNLKLVFKGGNVMRLLNNNVQEYLEPISNNLIFDIFEPFLKQSDNDFTIFMDPNLKYYDDLVHTLSNGLFDKLRYIKQQLYENREEYFNLLSLKKSRIIGAFTELRDKLNANTVRLSTTSDKIITLNEKTSQINVYEDSSDHSNSFIYNSLNKSLDFSGNSEKRIKFLLLRSKINFEVDGVPFSGELIDISIPHKLDAHHSELNTTKKYNDFLQNNVVTTHNDEYDFEYSIVNLHYLIYDLARILFEQEKYPWLNNKYEKRLARLIYLIFVEILNDNTLSYNTFWKCRVIFKRFIAGISDISVIRTGNMWLDLVLKYNKIIAIDSSKYYDFVKDTAYYSHAIRRICKQLERYSKGLERIDEEVLYDLDII